MTVQPLARAAALHPDDLAARHTLLGRLGELRANTPGVSQSTIGAELGISVEGVRQAEQATADPRLDRLARHLRAVRHQLVLTPQFDPDLPDDATTAVFRRMADAATYAEEADMYHRSAVLRHLVARRRWLGLSAREVSRKLGRSDSALSMLEQDVKPPMLSSYQIYTRAVGGVLRLDVARLEEPLT